MNHNQSHSNSEEKFQNHNFQDLMMGMQDAMVSSLLDSMMPSNQTMSEEKFYPIIRSGFVDLERSNSIVSFIETDEDLQQMALQYGREAEELKTSDILDTIMHLSFLGMISSQLREESNKRALLTPEMIRLARTEIKIWCRSSEISEALILSALRLWKKNGLFPGLETIINNYTEKACFCLRSFPLSEQRTLLRHFLMEFGLAPTCKQIFPAMEYYRIQREWPSLQQLDDMIERMQDLAHNMELDKKEQATPTANLHLLKPLLNEDENSTCAICQEQIGLKDSCYKLTPCNHLFHAKSEQCLGGCTVTTWLEKNDTCPVCRQKIILK